MAASCGRAPDTAQVGELGANGDLASTKVDEPAAKEVQSVAVALEGLPGGGIIVLKNFMIPMRDGVRLATDIYRPAGSEKYPVVLIRTPYGSETPEFWNKAKYYVEQGYVLAVQDCRGKYDSEGDWYGKRNEAQDGSDTITWLGTRAWSSGKVGMTGGSYMGMVQYQVADQENPYLKALVPLAAPTTLGRDLTDFDHLAVYSSRESTGTLGWMLGSDGRVAQSDPLLVQKVRDHLPMADYPKLLGRQMPWWKFMLNRRYGFWEEYYLRAARGEWSKPLPDLETWFASYRERYQRVKVPMLHISGWFDCCGEQLIKTFQMVRRYATEPIARANQQLTMGPWIHHPMGLSKEGGYDFGPQARMDRDEVSVQWFDHWLKGQENGVEKQPAVRVFIMGENRWREADDWPIPNTQFTKFYLRSRGNARLASGGGRLSRDPPGDELVDHYTYDPGQPAPMTIGPGLSYGPVSMMPLEKRSDVLVYSSERLKTPIEVTGPLTATLYVATSAPSTDVLVRLINVHPDGTPYNMFSTYAGIPYRTHWSKEVEKASDGTSIIKASIVLPPTSVLFKAGHRIRVEISSAFAPLYRGLNVEPGTESAATHWNVARQTVYHDRAHPSHILLPVIPR